MFTSMRSNTKYYDVSAAMKKLRKACILDWKCSKRSYFPTTFSNSTSKI